MKKKHPLARTVVFVVLIAALGGLGYYIYQRVRAPLTAPLVGGKSPSVHTPAEDPDSTASALNASVERSPAPYRTDPSPGDPEKPSPFEAPARDAAGQDSRVVTGTIRSPSAPESGRDSPPGSIESEPPPHEHADGSCEAIESEVQELFSDLDRKAYIADLNLESGTYDRFRDVAAALAGRPPVPAGEGLNPMVLLENVYHLYRSLNITDIRLIERVLRNERDDMEIYMQILYRWLDSDDRCDGDTDVRPSENTVYLYAGYFLNTTGGRAVMFRRDPIFRILISYYCLVAIHEADRDRRNIYGIDILPFIEPLREEIEYHPGLLFRDQYLSRLADMIRYYREKR